MRRSRMSKGKSRRSFRSGLRVHGRNRVTGSQRGGVRL